MSPTGRFTIVAPLPPHGEWRRALALDRSGVDPNAVVLAHVPASVVDDAARLAAMVRDVEAAGRLHHPYAVPVLGTETIEDGLAVVEAYRPGTTLRALLDAGGRLPVDVAVRVAIDACAAVARAHVLEAGDGRKLLHGALGPCSILVVDDGAALVTGFGTGSAAGPADDVRALAAVLHECLAGEPPGEKPAPLEEAGVTGALAAAVARGLRAGIDAPPSASALAEAIAAAGPVASHADVAAYLDAILPPSQGTRGELARALAAAAGPAAGFPAAPDAEEVSEDHIIEPTEPSARRPEPSSRRPEAHVRGFERVRRPEATPEPMPRPPATRPGSDPAGVFAAPAPPPRRSRAPALVAVACVAIGFAAGLEAFRRVGHDDAGGDSASSAPSALSPAAPQTPGAPSISPSAPALVPAERPSPASAATSTSASVAPPPSRPGSAAPPAARPAAGKRAAPKQSAKAAARVGPEAPPVGRGTLHVTAPEGAEVFLDDRRIGVGNVDVDVAVGAHRIEVRRGEARVGESFTLAPGETWTYDVTPTP